MVYQVAKTLRAKFMDTEIHNAKFLFFGVRTIDMQLKLYCFEKEREKRVCAVMRTGIVASVFDIFSLYVRYFASSFHFNHRFSVQWEECMSFFFISGLRLLLFDIIEFRLHNINVYNAHTHTHAS